MYVLLSKRLLLLVKVESEFILESERESFIEQVREVIEMADEKGERMKEGFPQVFLYNPTPYSWNITSCNVYLLKQRMLLSTILFLQINDQQQPELTVPMVPGEQTKAN